MAPFISRTALRSAHTKSTDPARNDGQRSLSRCGRLGASTRTPRSAKLAASDKGSAAAEWHRFSPDEQFLYVSNSSRRDLDALPGKSGWNADRGELFFDATSILAKESRRDQSRSSRNLYGSGPGGVWIFSPAGKHIATILMPERVANLNWGGSDGKSLYITASSSVYPHRFEDYGVRP